jgi:hypothetical protein
MRNNLAIVTLLIYLLSQQFSSLGKITNPNLYLVPDSVISVDVVPDYDTACVDTISSFYYLPNIPIAGQSGEWSCSSSALQLIIADSVVKVYPMVIDYINPDTYTLIWTETGNGFTAADTINVTFAPRPSAKIDVWYYPHCLGYPAELKAGNDYSIINWNWSDLDDGVIIHSATGTVNDPGPGPILVEWPNPSYQEQHYVRLIITNIWGCVSFANYETIPEPDHINVEIQVHPSSDGLPNGEIQLSPGYPYTQIIYHWIDTLGITWTDPTANFQSNLISEDYWFSATALSLVVPNVDQHYCTDTFNVTVPDTVYSIGGLDNEPQNLKIYPNPISEKAKVGFETPAIDDYSLWIFNENGQLVFHRKERLGKGKQELELNLSHFPKGFYSIQIQGTKSTSGNHSINRFKRQGRITKM